MCIRDSLSFGNQALAVRRLAEKRGSLQPKVYKLPDLIDKKIAYIKLKSLGVKIEKLTPEQKKYLKSWSA